MFYLATGITVFGVACLNVIRPVIPVDNLVWLIWSFGGAALIIADPIYELATVLKGRGADV